MQRGWKFSFHVSVVVASIIYIYFSTVFIYIDHWFGLWTSPGLLNAFVFTFLTAMCVYTYARAVFTDPGRIPSSFIPDVEDADNPIHEIKRKGGDLRYCQKCALHKPPRAHHCRVCNRCVLRMVLLVGSLTIDSPKDDEENESFFRTFYVISGLLLLPLSIALSFFWSWHVYLVLQNKTTIEYHEGVRAMWLAEKGGFLYSHPYNLGAYENLISVLGPNILCWVCPTADHIGSGLRFRTGVDKQAAT
ncbi:OLC1v1034876C2 [Oldenlandia corymbosa var. corymbosa]|uniref:S-acyltransferase n=1 Tax=Oldenlandia corymbosa var. corymbosa TaxID=529605 RepID=A0AAV1CU92_OLDCO|nr:OLC1v1034876C2 [Oldenlandia corymbosa var. corymbosa]